MCRIFSGSLLHETTTLRTVSSLKPAASIRDYPTALMVPFLAFWRRPHSAEARVETALFRPLTFNLGL